MQREVGHNVRPNSSEKCGVPPIQNECKPHSPCLLGWKKSRKHILLGALVESARRGHIRLQAQEEPRLVEGKKPVVNAIHSPICQFYGATCDQFQGASFPSGNLIRRSTLDSSSGVYQPSLTKKKTPTFHVKVEVLWNEAVLINPPKPCWEDCGKDHQHPHRKARVHVAGIGPVRNQGTQITQERPWSGRNRGHRRLHD